MIQLVLDFGNTLQKVALFEGDKLLLLEHYREITGEDIRHFTHDHPGITAGILSSVIHHDEAIPGFLREEIRLIELDEQTPVPIRNLYGTPDTLGKDRLAAAVAGAALFPALDVLVVSAGTALTFDFVDRSGAYQGGSIAPGMEMRFRALHTFTGKLPLLSYQDQAKLIGNTTHASILSGVVNGIAAEIEGIVSRYMADFPELKVILTGGDLDYLVNRLKISIFARPNMVIQGLQQILNFNVNQAR